MGERSILQTRRVKRCCTAVLRSFSFADRGLRGAWCCDGQVITIGLVQPRIALGAPFPSTALGGRMFTAPVLYPIYQRKRKEKRGDVEGHAGAAFLASAHTLCGSLLQSISTESQRGPCRSIFGQQGAKKLHSWQCAMELEQLRRVCAVFA